MGTFAGVWHLTETRTSNLPGEATEALVLMSVFYVPPMFTLLYIPIRLLLIRQSANSWGKTPCYLPLWAVGTTLGPVFAFLATHTKFFWILNPIIRLLGV